MSEGEWNEWVRQAAREHMVTLPKSVRVVPMDTHLLETNEVPPVRSWLFLKRLALRHEPIAQNCRQRSRSGYAGHDPQTLLRLRARLIDVVLEPKRPTLRFVRSAC